MGEVRGLVVTLPTFGSVRWEKTSNYRKTTADHSNTWLNKGPQRCRVDGVYWYRCQRFLSPGTKNLGEFCRWMDAQVRSSLWICLSVTIRYTLAKQTLWNGQLSWSVLLYAIGESFTKHPAEKPQTEQAYPSTVDEGPRPSAMVKQES